MAMLAHEEDGMKRRRRAVRRGAFSLIAAAAVGAAVVGCSPDEDDSADGATSYNVVQATETKNYSYGSSTTDVGNFVFEVKPNVKSVNISGVASDKSIYLAKVNTAAVSVKLSDLRSVVDGSSSGYRAAAGVGGSLDDAAQIPDDGIRHFHAPAVTLDDMRSAARVAVGSDVSPAVHIDETVGTTKKNIYVDTNVNMNAYEAKPATLRAKGTNCYVWVVDDYYTDGTASGAKVTTSIAQQFADKFDEFYPLVRHVFGEESDKLIYSTAQNVSSLTEALISMNTYSDTGTKVNIVLYDIGADYNQSSQCGVLGYFFSKDYFTQVPNAGNVLKYSNQGKYFYIDSAYAVSKFSTTVSTLAHEFQHMVNYGVKDLNGYGTPDTSYNEMLSMLCEDMMADKLGLTDSNNVKSERLPYFNTSYFLSGIREYRNDSYAALSYSTSYAFGAWLCRQYGGAALVQKIMANSKVDNASLVAAVNDLNGKNYTFSELFQQFLAACTNGGATTGFTHNKDAAQTLEKSSYNYPMTAINLRAADYKRERYLVNGQASAAYNSDSDKYGPFLFSNKYGIALRPDYGMTLHKLGATSGGDLSLQFTESGADCVNMYVIIQ